MSRDASAGASDESEVISEDVSKLTRQRVLAVVAVLIAVALIVPAALSIDMFDSTPDSCAVEPTEDAGRAPSAPSVDISLTDELPLTRRRLDLSPAGQDIASTDDTGASRDAGTNPVMPDASDLTVMSDGRFLFVHEEDDQQRALVSRDAESWDEIVLPEELGPLLIDASDSHIVAVAKFGPRDNRWAAPRVFVTSDQGNVWREVPVNTAKPDRFVEQHIYTFDLVIIQENIVLLASVHSFIDATSLLIDRGLLDDGDRAMTIDITDDEIEVMPWPPDSLDAPTTITVTLDELNLDTREQHLLRMQRLYPTGADGLGYVRAYVGNADGLDISTEWTASIAEVVGTEDGPLVYINDEIADRHRYLLSPDGISWGEVHADAPQYDSHIVGVDKHGDAWLSFRSPAYDSVLSSVGCAQPVQHVALLENFEPTHIRGSLLTVGQGGQALSVVASELSVDGCC